MKTTITALMFLGLVACAPTVSADTATQVVTDCVQVARINFATWGPRYNAVRQCISEHPGTQKYMDAICTTESCPEALRWWEHIHGN